MPRAVVLFVILAFVVLAALLVETTLELREVRAQYHDSRLRLQPFPQLTPLSAAVGGMNAERFRGDSIAPEKPATTLRVFTLGGATTLGVSNAFEDSYPRMLQRRLQQQYPGVRVEVQNAGAEWFTTAHSLVSYALRVRRFNPDIVIVVHAFDDLCRSFSPPGLATGAYQSDYSHYLGPVIEANSFLESGDGRSGWAVWRLLRRAWHRAPAGLDLSPHGIERLKSSLHPAPVTEFKSLEAFKANYDLLVRTIKTDRHVVVVGSEPSLYKDGLSAEEQAMVSVSPVLCAENGTYPNPDSMREGLRQFNAASRAIAVAHGVGVLDFDGIVPKSSRYFQNDVRLTTGGNDILARMAAAWIINHPVPPLPAIPPEPEGTHEHHIR